MTTANQLAALGNGPAFSAYKSSGAGVQTVTSNVFTKVTFDTEEFDTNNNFASSTFTPTVAGYYQVNALINMYATSGTLSQASSAIYKNGSVAKYSLNYSTLTELTSVISFIVYCNGTTDYLEIYIRAVGTTPLIGASASQTVFSASLIKGV